ncbi:MAG: hypothetical protein ACXAEU_14720 [Candidatus Hodarchaeales archaeon]
MRGRPKNIGVILALLSLKARSPEFGLDQEEIADLTGKSLSTISRALNDAVELKYCEYKETMNEIFRRERKYYVRTSFKEMVLERLTKTADESKILQDKINKIRSSMKEEEITNNNELLEHFDRLDKQATLLIEFNRKIIELSQEFFKDL